MHEQIDFKDVVVVVDDAVVVIVKKKKSLIFVSDSVENPVCGNMSEKQIATLKIATRCHRHFQGLKMKVNGTEMG